MNRRKSLWCATALVLSLVATSPVAAAPVEQTLREFGLVQGKDSPFRYRNRTITGDTATFTGITTDGGSADSLVIRVVPGSGPAQIASARFTNLRIDDKASDSPTIRVAEIVAPSNGFLKIPLDRMAKLSAGETDSDRKIAAERILFEGISLSSPTAQVFSIGRVLLEGLDLTEERTGFTKFEINDIAVSEKNGTKVSVGTLRLAEPNEAFMKAIAPKGFLEQVVGDGTPSAIQQALLNRFSGIGAREWRLDGLVLEIPETKAPEAGEGTDVVGVKPASFAQPAEDPDTAEPVPDVTSTPSVPFGPATLRLGSFAVLDQTPDRIGRIEVRDFSFKGKAPQIEDFDVSLGRMDYTGIDLKLLGAAIASQLRSQAKAAEAAAGETEKSVAPPTEEPAPFRLPPDSGLMLGYEDVIIDRFQMSGAGLQLDFGSIAMRSRKDAQGRVVGIDQDPFAYSIRVTNAAQVGGKFAKGILDGLGYKELTLAGTATRIDYSPEADRMVFPGGSLTLRDGFTLQAAASILGFRAYTEKAYSFSPTGTSVSAVTSATADLLSSLKLENMTISFQDQSLIGRILKVTTPASSDKTPEQARAELVKSLEAEAKKHKAGTLQNLLASRAAEFMKKPEQTITLSVNPPKPIGTEIFTSQTSPDPKALGITVSVQ